MKEFYVDSNRIQLVEPGAIAFLPKTLEKISIGDNALSFGGYCLEIGSLPVKILNASDLSKTHEIQAEDVDFWCVNSTRAEISTYEIPKQTQYLFHTPNVGFNIFQSIQLPKYLREIIFKSNGLRLELPSLEFKDNVLEKIDFSSNVFFSLKGPLLNLSHLNVVDLSNNFCSYISKFFFSNTLHIKRLALNNNLLGFHLPSDVDGEIFRNLTELEDSVLQKTESQYYQEKFSVLRYLLKNSICLVTCWRPYRFIQVT